MKVLLIEDDISKEENIKSVLYANYSHISLQVEHSIMSGKVSVKNGNADIVLLDMSLPLYDNDDLERGMEEHIFTPFGGMDILDEIDRLNKKSKVIVITAYEVLGDDNNKKDLPTLDKELKRDYPDIVVDSIFYNISSNDWKTKIVDYMDKYIKGEL